MQAIRANVNCTKRMHGCGASAAAARPLALSTGLARGAHRVLAAAQADSGPPPGCARYTVELRKPLGIVLEQKGAGGPIVVAAITPDGNADKTGQLSLGDQLISTTGVTYNKTEDYLGVTVRKGQEVVTLNCASESFKTVSAAIGSHPASIPVRLTFQRCDASSVTQ